MKKNRIRITEGCLKNVIKKCLKEALNLTFIPRNEELMGVRERVLYGLLERYMEMSDTTIKETIVFFTRWAKKKLKEEQS